MSNSEKSSVYLDPFEMDLIKCVDKYLGNANLLLAVSGGMDSMALLKSLHRVSDKRDLKIRVCYVHHGKQGESDYRDRCYDLVKKTAQDFSLGFVSNYPHDLPDKVLRSEEDFRDFRYKFLEKVLGQNEILVTAHHQDDLLETRMIRLIRGTSDKGISAMEMFSGNRFRPFLETSLHQIENYAKKMEIKYLSDPSNEDMSYLRNWLRLDFLPRLDSYREGSLASLARSLNLLAENSGNHLWVKNYYDANGVDLVGILCLSDTQKQQVFANYLYDLEHFSFQKNQLKELVRRLDTLQNDTRLRLMGVDWVVDSKRAYVCRKK